MLGISLCGGGSKGSYELGAWDAFIELGFTFDVVTGTSIGCLNGGMLVQNEFERCEQLWNEINMTKISSNGLDLDEVSIRRIIKHADFKPFIFEYIKGFGIDVKPFKKLLTEYFDCKKIKESNVKFGLIMSTFPIVKKVEVLVNELEEDEMLDYVLASASAFPVFPTCKINSKQYIDGGYTDNLPIDFAFKLGAKKVIAVDLNHNVVHKHYLNHPFVEYIYPKWDLGSFLHFNPSVINRNRMLGYYDTMKYYGKYDGYKYTFSKIKSHKELSLKINEFITNDAIAFKDKKLKLLFKNEGYVNIYSLLNKHINTNIRYHDYLVKCLEELCVVFNISPIEVYNVKQLIKIVLDNIKLEDSTNFIVEYNKIKKEDKRKEFIDNCNKKELIHYIYNNEVDDKFKYFLLRTIPEVYLCLVLLKSL